MKAAKQRISAPGDKLVRNIHVKMDFPDGAVVKNLPANAGDARDTVSIPGCGRSPGVRNGNRLQYSCLRKFHEQRSLVGYSQ